MPTVYAHHTEKDMNLALVQPWCSIGSDGSAYATEGPLRRGNPHPRNFGTFPRVLGVYVRERGLLTLEDAVRKMTSLNAAKLGIARPRPAAAGRLRRRDDLRPGDGDRPRDLHRAVPVQRGDRVRDRQRPGRARPRQAHRRPARPRTAPPPLTRSSFPYLCKELTMSTSGPSPAPGAPRPEELKKAFKAFKKRLRVTRLDAESSIAGGPLSGGKRSEIIAITPPHEYPQADLEQLVRQGD